MHLRQILRPGIGQFRREHTQVTTPRPAAVIVLAAGEGTRMRSATPKVLHTLAGRSMLGHALVAARSLEPGRLAVVVRHGRDAVAAHARELDPDVLLADQDDVPGTGRAVQIGLSVLDAAAQACRAGVKRSHMVSFAENGSLLTELFTRDGGGTLVDQEQFESLREATIEDVGGLIDLITPLEDQGILVRRSREVLEREIEQFTIVERDGLIIACAALYPIADSDAGELACLAVNPEYRHGGRGDELLERIEERARALGLKTLYVLTTRTAHWFRERGFQPSGVERLPAARASLYNFQRNSKVFEKAL